jgi:hypothetical protein
MDGCYVCGLGVQEVEAIDAKIKYQLKRRWVMVVEAVFLVDGSLIKVSWLVFSLGAQIVYLVTLFVIEFEEFYDIIDAVSISRFKAFRRKTHRNYLFGDVTHVQVVTILFIPPLILTYQRFERIQAPSSAWSDLLFFIDYLNFSFDLFNDSFLFFII